ncbi:MULTISPECIES: cytochrome P450 [Pseudonocardia]|uniref:Cytochrome P450-SU2 n=2 Tax=Pseudonocardia TaxID=1847 RepID=A0A1Y2N621_PSEAH|nr:MULTISPECIES: cytochrome P450 [Pseudonocardia]OSY42914.1 Cytochrome P450-SU2 [Pseudonocardia autotrophica]TDN77491.1 cytochrome P450 [Pseudonocardia autotrophica]
MQQCTPCSDSVGWRGTRRRPGQEPALTADENTTATDSPIALRSLVPEDLLERTPSCPFDPAPGLAARRGAGAVQPVELRNGARAFLVTGFDEAREVLADSRFSADRVRYKDATKLSAQEVEQLAAATERGEPLRPADVQRNDGMFIFMDPPEHTRIRRLLQGQFTVRRMRALEERMTEIAAAHIDTMLAGGPGADLVPAYALPLPSQMICELLGVDYADRQAFQDNTTVGLNANSTDEERGRALGELYTFLSGLVAHKKEHPGDDLLSGLIHESDPPLPDNQLIDISLVLLGAGHETTANMLALGVFALLQHPEQLAAVTTGPDAIDGAVEELLRYLSIIQLGVSRVATETVTLGGVDIPAGSTVMVAVPETNRDERHLDAVDELDVRRGRVPHLAFGHGVHQCIGSQLARVEMKVGFRELFARIPGLRLAVAAEDVPLRNDMLIFGVHSLPVTWN